VDGVEALMRWYMDERLKQELLTAWEEYVIYARSSVEAGAFPAPFGATIAERKLKQRITEACSKSVRPVSIDVSCQN
jgi:hypothetical protein